MQICASDSFFHWQVHQCKHLLDKAGKLEKLTQLKDAPEHAMFAPNFCPCNSVHHFQEGLPEPCHRLPRQSGCYSKRKGLYSLLFFTPVSGFLHTCFFCQLPLPVHTLLGYTFCPACSKEIDKAGTAAAAAAAAAAEIAKVLLTWLMNTFMGGLKIL